MARDPLPVLLRLREIALDTARRALATSLRCEAEAIARAAEAEAAIGQEMLVLAQAADDRMADAYAGWLLQAQVKLHEAQAAVSACAAATAEARDALNEARVGTRVIQAAVAHLQEERRLSREKTEQAAIDEAAVGRRRK